MICSDFRDGKRFRITWTCSVGHLCLNLRFKSKGGKGRNHCQMHKHGHLCLVTYMLHAHANSTAVSVLEGVIVELDKMLSKCVSQQSACSGCMLCVTMTHD